MKALPSSSSSTSSSSISCLRMASSSNKLLFVVAVVALGLLRVVKDMPFRMYTISNKEEIETPISREEKESIHPAELGGRGITSISTSNVAATMSTTAATATSTATTTTSTNVKQPKVKAIASKSQESKSKSTVLRYDWTNLERLSWLAKTFETHQNNCSKPFAKYGHAPSGLGSCIHMHSIHFCSIMQTGDYRFKAVMPWLWLDVPTCAQAAKIDLDSYSRGYTERTVTDTKTGVEKTLITPISSMDCYFPGTDPLCPEDTMLTKLDFDTLPRYAHFETGYDCEAIHAIVDREAGVRAATAEYYFTRVSPLLQREAERQFQLIFGNGTLPQNLITIHMRWGDKHLEMELQGADKYVAAVRDVLAQRKNMTNDVRYWNDSYTGVNIYLATEDPRALEAFRNEAPKDWNIFVDDFFPPAAAQSMMGLAHADVQSGWITLALLLLSMEANTFVLTTASNWSRLINELRKNVLDLRCNNCTVMADLVYAEW